MSIRLDTPPPASATLERRYWVEVPKDAAGSDDIVLTNANATHDTFTARMDELVPTPAGMLQARIGKFAERIVRGMLPELSAQAEKKLREQGR